MQTKEFEWALYLMAGNSASKDDEWMAGGTADMKEIAEREANHYLNEYASDDAGFRYEIFEVTRKSLGGLARIPKPKDQ